MLFYLSTKRASPGLNFVVVIMWVQPHKGLCETNYEPSLVLLSNKNVIVSTKEVKAYFAGLEF